MSTTLRLEAPPNVEVSFWLVGIALALFEPQTLTLLLSKYVSKVPVTKPEGAELLIRLDHPSAHVASLFVSSTLRSLTDQKSEVRKSPIS